MNRILFVGDISWDMSFLTPRVPGPDEKVHVDGFVEGLGGVACNAAVAAARADAQVLFLGVCGTDILSQGASDALAASGIEAHLATRDGSICRVVTMIEGHGEKRLLLYPGVSLYPAERDLEMIDWDRVDHVHTAVYGTSARSLIAAARLKGATWSLDLEPSTFPGGIADLDYAIDGAALVIVNDRAAEAIGEGAVATLLSMGAKTVIRSRGPEGATWTDGRDSFSVPVPDDLDIVDTTGAGDCLAGWYLAGLSKDLSPKHALTDAVHAASLSCRAVGAQAGYPTQQELDNKKGTDRQ
ncbi:MAG: carbohydrate kinase family protein [Pseudomonadota bacterium]|nr:carbohydrate kinase family protein [Pseudomonadota bacterium]